MSVGETIRIDGFFTYAVDAIKEGGMGRVLFLTRLVDASPLDMIHRAHLAAKTFKNAELVRQHQDLFLRELRTWLSLDAPNLAQLLKVVPIDGRLFALMPQYQCSLRDVLNERRKVSLEEAKAVIAASAHCLDAVFTGRNIVHLDLKPDNILMAVRNGATTFHVSDWGISTLQRRSCSSWPANNGIPSEFATTMAGMGTLLYMAPERLCGLAPTIAADIYSLGMMLFELLFGCLPFDLRAAKPPELQIVEGDYYLAASSLLATTRVSGMAEFLLRTICPQPKARFSSYRELLRSLRSVGNRGEGYWPVTT